MMGSIASQKTALAESINKLPPFMRDFNTTSVNLRAALDDVDPLVDASKPVATRLRPFFANFRAASADLVPTVRDLDQIVSDPGKDNDLVDLTRLQPNLARVAVGPLKDNGKRRQGSFPEGATALQDSLNELAMFRAYTPELTGWFDDFSGSSGVQDANSGTYQVTAEFTNASQLVGGEVVTIGGTPAGKVSKIELADDGNALITFSVDEANAPLQRGTVAQIRSFSLSGVANRQIELTLPGEGQGTGEIPDGGTMDRSETISEVDLDEIFNTLNPKTAADFKKVIKGFARSYQGVAVEGNEGFRYLNPFLSTSRRTFAELTRDTPALEQLIVDGSQLSGALASRRDDISALIGNLNTMMGSLARQKTALAASINKLPPFMRDFNTTGVNLRAALDDVDPLVDASKPVAKRLRPFFANFRAASADLVPTVRDLDRIVSDPGKDNDLVDLTRLQPNLAKVAVGPVSDNGKRRQGSFPEGVTALQDSLNELAMFRAYTPELTGWFNDFSGSSGVQDANGGISRIGVTFNTFTLAANDLPIVDLAATLKTTGQDYIDIGNYQRCPGSNEGPHPTDRTRSPTRTTQPAPAARSTAIRRSSPRGTSGFCALGRL